MDRDKLILAASLAVVSVIAVYLLIPPRDKESSRAFATVESYLRATYARDFGRVYDHLSSSDQQVRTRQNFMNSQGPYSGFTLEVAQQLAGFMKIWLIDRQVSSSRLIIKIGYRVPAPAELNGLLLNWDQDRLNALSKEHQYELLAALGARHKNGSLLNVEGQETIELIKEANDWKVFLDWAAGTHVRLQDKLPDDSQLQVRFGTAELMAKNDELFLVNLKISNRGRQAVTFTVAHLVDPPEVADDLQLVECGLLTPITLEAKQEKEFAMAYQLSAAAGQIHREIYLTYDFKLK